MDRGECRVFGLHIELAGLGAQPTVHTGFEMRGVGCIESVGKDGLGVLDSLILGAVCRFGHLREHFYLLCEAAEHVHVYGHDQTSFIDRIFRDPNGYYKTRRRFATLGLALTLSRPAVHSARP